MSRTLAFTADVAARLTGVSESRLRRWDNDGFYSPSYANPNRRSPYSRIYSFLDLVALRTISRINKLGVSIQKLKKVGEYIKELPNASWSSTRFFVAGQDVFFSHDEALIAVRPLGQRPISEIVNVDLEPIIIDTRERVEKLGERPPDQIGRVVRERYIMGGKPVIAGTRIPTATIVEFVQRGYTTEQIIQNYPRLVPEDIQAAIEEEARPTAHRRSA
jgi:uncharacterized protein (DUF433 family)